METSTDAAMVALFDPDAPDDGLLIETGGDGVALLTLRYGPVAGGALLRAPSGTLAFRGAEAKEAPGPTLAVEPGAYRADVAVTPARAAGFLGWRRLPAEIVVTLARA